MFSGKLNEKSTWKSLKHLSDKPLETKFIVTTSDHIMTLTVERCVLFHLYWSLKVAVYPWGTECRSVEALFVVKHLTSSL